MKNDLTQGKPIQVLLLFTMPMLIGNIFQQLYNMVDSVVVGKYVGAEALAAVGASFPVNFLILSLAIGLTNGSSVVVSQLFGAGKYEETRRAVYTSLIFLTLCSVVASVVAFLLAPWMLTLLKTPSDIFADALIYLQIIFAGMVFTVMYNACAAIYRALGDSKTPLRFLIIASAINVVGDLVFVLVFDMGVAGVAVATILSQAVSAGLSLYHLFKRSPILRFGKEHAIYDRVMVGNILRYGLPSSGQQLMVCLRMMLIQGLVNSHGSAVIAGFTSANKIESFVLMPMMNIGMAYTMYVGQNMGNRDMPRVKAGLKASLQLTIGLCAAISVLIFLFRIPLLGLFLNDNAPANVLVFGSGYLQGVSLFYWICAASMVFGGLLRGSGDNSFYMFASLVSMLVRVASAYLLAPYLGFAAIWWSNPISWVVELVLTVLRYRSGKWKTKGLISQEDAATA